MKMRPPWGRILFPTSFIYKNYILIRMHTVRRHPPIGGEYYSNTIASIKADSLG